MHELSIAMSILEIAEEESARRGGAPVASIHIKLGPLSGVVPAALQSAYELAREASPFGDSTLVIKEVPVVIYCPTCEVERTVESIQSMLCGHCQTPSADVRSGNELEITAMEIVEPLPTDEPPLVKR